jgi:signal transduction histidine kinase
MRLRWQLGMMAALALSAALVYVLLQAPDYTEAEYFEDVARLQHIRQLDAQWELDVMKARLDMLRGYDALVAPLRDLAALPPGLNKFPRNTELALGAQAYLKALEGKAAVVESFKSHNAVFRNSLAYLSAMADDFELHAAGPGPRHADEVRVMRAVRETLLETLEYIEHTADDDRAEIELQLAALLSARRGLSPVMRQLTGNFELHVRIVLGEHAEINRLVAEIMDAPTERRLNRIHAVLSDELQQASGRVRQHRLVLLALSVALSALLLYAAVGLLRSHATINRYNASLQQANDTLECRVQERTRQLEHAQSQLLAAARDAGKAEVATNVLHNVGNVLNSVGVSAALLQQQVKASRGPGLDLAVALLREQEARLGDFLANDERGRCLPEYLEGLALVLRTEREALAGELQQLHVRVDHVKEIVAAQQAYAGAASLLEQCLAQEVIEQALSMSAVSLARHSVAVIRDYAGVPPLRMDRHRVLQILVNLIGNAWRAMEGMPYRAHRITLRLRALDAQRLRIEVVDNGEGILPENLERIFAHGFTTRKDGHGFGLHSCILAARAMGGSLSAHSEGAGLGATFTLELPCLQEERHERAAA